MEIVSIPGYQEIVMERSTLGGVPGGDVVFLYVGTNFVAFTEAQWGEFLVKARSV